MCLESGYSTDLSVPACRKQENHRTGLQHHQGSARTVRRVHTAEEPTESAERRAPVWEAPVEGARGVRSQGSRESLNFSGDRSRLQDQSGERERSDFHLIF